MCCRQFTYQGTIPKESGEMRTAVVDTPQGKHIVTISTRTGPIFVRAEERDEAT